MTDGMACPRCGKPSIETSIYCKECSTSKLSTRSKKRYD